MAFSGISCRIDSRSTSKGVNLKPRVIGKAVYSAGSVDEACLDSGVLLQGCSRFLNIPVNPEFGRGKDLVTRAKNLGRLAQLAFVACSKYDLHGHKSSGKIISLQL